MRVIAIDYGLKRTGIAIAELSGEGAGQVGMALPFEMFEGLPDPQLAAAIADLARREHIDVIVAGMPYNADGTASSQSERTERFVAILQGLLPPTVQLQRISEYLSTHGAEGKLAGHYTRQQKRQRVDALAAAGILQDWLDQKRPT